MRFKQKFIDDVEFFIKNRHNFNFYGGKALPEIIYSNNGVSGLKAFYEYDTHGKIKPTKHPNLFKTLLIVKASINLHIKMWAQGRADGTLPLIEFAPELIESSIINDEIKSTYNSSISSEFGLPMWVINAVEQQKGKYYDI